jgi:hypothetical protein
MVKFSVLGSYVRCAWPVGAFVRVAEPFVPVEGVGVGPDGVGVGVPGPVVGVGVPGPVVGATVGVPGPVVGATVGVRVGTVGPPMMIAVQPLTRTAIAPANAIRARNRRFTVFPPPRAPSCCPHAARRYAFDTITRATKDPFTGRSSARAFRLAYTISPIDDLSTSAQWVTAKQQQRYASSACKPILLLGGPRATQSPLACPAQRASNAIRKPHTDAAPDHH